MRCKYCGSENTELRSVKHLIWTYDCNRCGLSSDYQGVRDEQDSLACSVCGDEHILFGTLCANCIAEAMRVSASQNSRLHNHF